MVVFELEKRLSPSDNKQHISFPFDIDREYKRLEIHYSYHPKRLENIELSEELIKKCYINSGLVAKKADILREMPLHNLVTISLDNEKGMVGNAHRHHNDMVYHISPKESSYGFSPCKIEKGEWLITLSTHAMLSDEVLVKVKVAGYDD